LLSGVELEHPRARKKCQQPLAIFWRRRKNLEDQRCLRVSFFLQRLENTDKSDCERKHKGRDRDCPGPIQKLVHVIRLSELEFVISQILISLNPGR